MKEEAQEVDMQLDREWKACRREIVGIYTKGTFNPGILESKPEAKGDKKSKRSPKGE